MNILNKRIFLTLFFSFLLWVVNWASIKFGWYYLVYEIDMLPHFLGGMAVFLIVTNFAWILRKEIKLSQALWLVFLVTIAWEFFEIYLDNTFGVDYAKTFDSISDICLGMLGAVVASFLIAKNDKKIYNKINGE